MIDRLRQMAIFAKTVDHGSFRGAARELRLSPSVVSHHISELEDHLGVALLYRSTRKLALTPDGQRVLGAARAMIEAVETELSTLMQRGAEPSGELRLTAPSVLTRSKLMRDISAFAEAFPKVSLTLDFTDARRDLIEDGFDIAIRMMPKARNSATTRKLFKGDRVLIASPDFLANHGPFKDPKDLTRAPWISLIPAQHVPVEFHHKTKPSQRISVQPHIRSSDATASYALARSGAGLATVPSFLIGQALKAGKVVKVLPNWDLDAIDIVAQWPPNAPKGGLIKLMLGYLGPQTGTR